MKDIWRAAFYVCCQAGSNGPRSVKFSIHARIPLKP